MKIEHLKSPVSGLVCVLMLAGTVAGGLVQRCFSSAAGNAKLLTQAAATLDIPLPANVGGWRLLTEPKLEAEITKMLECPAYISRVYVHDKTGDRVSVAVLLGPPGQIAVHTPEICYSSQDFSVLSERRLTSLPGGVIGEHTFWDVSFLSSNNSGSKLRVLYAWSAGTRWEASEDPRFAYGGRPYLYKIQVAGPTIPDSAEFDPCQDFLTQFIVQLQAQLLPADPA